MAKTLLNLEPLVKDLLGVLAEKKGTNMTQVVRDLVKKEATEVIDREELNEIIYKHSMGE